MDNNLKRTSCKSLRHPHVSIYGPALLSVLFSLIIFFGRVISFPILIPEAFDEYKFIEATIPTSSGPTSTPASTEPEPEPEPTSTPASTEPEPEPEPTSNASAFPEPEPNSSSSFDIFGINDASGIFVTNMGLVFSILYGFVFSRSYARYDEISRVFSVEAANLHQLVNIVRLIDFDQTTQHDLLIRLRNYAFQIRTEITTGTTLHGVNEHSVDDLYALIPYIKKLLLLADGTNEAFDRELLNGSLESIKSLLEARYERWDLFSKSVHWVIYGLLVLSSQLMFFGISLMQSGAAVLDLLFCFLTVLSLVAIMTALSDLDLFYAGHIIVDVSRLDHVFSFGTDGDGSVGNSGNNNSVNENRRSSTNTNQDDDNNNYSKKFAENMMKGSKDRPSLLLASRQILYGTHIHQRNTTKTENVMTGVKEEGSKYSVLEMQKATEQGEKME